MSLFWIKQYGHKHKNGLVLCMLALTSWYPSETSSNSLQMRDRLYPLARTFSLKSFASFRLLKWSATPSFFQREMQNTVFWNINSVQVPFLQISYLSLINQWSLKVFEVTNLRTSILPHLTYPPYTQSQRTNQKS